VAKQNAATDLLSMIYALSLYQMYTLSVCCCQCCCLLQQHILPQKLPCSSHTHNSFFTTIDNTLLLVATSVLNCNSSRTCMHTLLCYTTKHQLLPLPLLLLLFPKATATSSSSSISATTSSIQCCCCCCCCQSC
jgi:hypothetical protein